MRLVVPLTLLLLAGCSGATAPEDGLLLRTGRAEYAPWDTVAVTIRNALDAPVYVAHCNHRISLVVEKRTGDAWQVHKQSNGPLCQGIYPAGDTAVAAGAAVAESVQIAETGQFRLLLYGRLAHEDFGSLVVYSPPFTVRYPPD